MNSDANLYIGLAFGVATVLLGGYALWLLASRSRLKRLVLAYRNDRKD